MSQQIPERTWALFVTPISGTPPQKVVPGQTKDLSQLDVEFRIRKTLKAKPNTADIRIWGLSAATRQLLESATRLQVALFAGYNNSNEQLFFGETRHAYSKINEGSGEVETYLETGTSEADMKAAHVSVSYGDQLTVKDAFAAIFAALPNLSPSDLLADRFLNGNGAAGTILHPMGGAVSQSAVRVIDDICRSAGLEWSVQDTFLQILPKNQPLQGKRVVLSSASGLIGSPAIDHKGELKCKSLIQPGLSPGSQLRLDGKSISGDFRIEAVEYVGNTSPGAPDWTAEITASLL